MKEKENKMGQLLLKSLTKEQIACMLDVIASSGGLKSLKDDFKKADPDMAATVDKILKGDSAATDGETASPMASHKRTLEYWDSLWRQWLGIVAGLGDEDGTYAVQDHHWEEPYFASASFASDLEPIARDMLGLIDDVYNSVEDSELFTEALEEIEESIASYPEWMGVEYGDPCELEKNTTLCVLNWLWSGLEHEPNLCIILIEKVVEIEESYELIYLNQNALIEFFIKLPAAACREIYTYFQGKTHAIDLGNVYSPWHQINHNYESRFDSTKYLDTCQRHLAQNWRYGRPLVDDAVNRKDYQEAESWLEKTFKKYWPWLARLTSDLPDSKTLEEKYPVFYEIALPEEASPDDLLANFRCSSLKKMKAGASLLLAMDVWQEHLHLIVPDPTNVYKSDYSHHAAWSKAVHELNQKAYQALLSKWRKKHNRRRNLWRDMRAIELSV